MKLSLLYLLLSVTSAQAAIVYNSQALNTINAFSSDPDNVQGYGAIRLTVEPASALDGATIQGIRFRGSYSTSLPVTGADKFTVAWFAEDGSTDAGGFPIPGANLIAPESAILAEPRTLSSDTIIFGYETYDYGINLATPITLSAGNYWLSIANDFDGTGDTATNSWSWAYQFSDPINRRVQSTVSQLTGYTGNGDTLKANYAFSDTPFTVIPEPSHYSLLLGLGVLGVMLRRTRYV